MSGCTEDSALGYAGERELRKVEVCSEPSIVRAAAAPGNTVIQCTMQYVV